MASLTGSGGRHMGRMLPGCPNPIMAGLATAGNPIVIEVGDSPTVGGMAGITAGIGQHM
jgi:hypothetical protein